jgi:TonB family protein
MWKPVMPPIGFAVVVASTVRRCVIVTLRKMTTPRKKRESGSRQAILIALLLSLLLHQLFLTGVGSLFDFSEEPLEHRHEVVLREEPPKQVPKPKTPEVEEPKKTAQPEQPKPKKTQKRVAKKPTPMMPPSETTTEPEPMVATPEVPHEPHPAAGPTPTPEVPPTPPNLNLNWKSFEKIFGATAKVEREAYAEAALEKRRERGSFSNYSGRVMRAVRNHKSFVKPGQQEVLGAVRQRVFHNYIDAIHETSIHPLFADSFLASLPSLSPDDPLNNWSLHMVAEFEIFESGQISEIRVVKSSGNMVFDAGAVDSIYRSAPFPPPPKSVLSWNRRVYLRWGFYRNHRKCGVFNVEPFILKAPGAKKEALPVDKFTVDG